MSRKQTVARIFQESYCRLAPSGIHGIGVFAVRDIPKGVNPFRIGIRYPNSWIEITETELARAPVGVAALLATLFLWDDEGKFRVPSIGTNLVDIGSYLNHSDEPNLRTADGNVFRARRRIAKGEELTVDYASYGATGLLGRDPPHD
jgi:SET domain-containing protein